MCVRGGGGGGEFAKGYMKWAGCYVRSQNLPSYIYGGVYTTDLALAKYKCLCVCVFCQPWRISQVFICNQNNSAIFWPEDFGERNI